MGLIRWLNKTEILVKTAYRILYSFSKYKETHQVAMEINTISYTSSTSKTVINIIGIKITYYRSLKTQIRGNTVLLLTTV